MLFLGGKSEHEVLVIFEETQPRKYLELVKRVLTRYKYTLIEQQTDIIIKATSREQGKEIADCLNK